MSEDDAALSYYADCSPTNDIRCQISWCIKHVVPVIMLCIGTLGNALNIAILSRKKFKNSPFQIGLCVLAVSDTLCLLLNVLSVHVVQRFDNELLHLLCRYDCLVLSSQVTFSFYILAILTMERVLYVRHTPIYRRIVSKTSYGLLLLSVLLIILLFHVVMIFGGFSDIPTEILNKSTALTTTSGPENALMPDYDPSNTSTANTLMTNDSLMNTSSTGDRPICLYISRNHGYYRPILMPLLYLFDNVIPLIIILVGNILIIRTVRASRARVNGDNNRENRTQDTATKIATTICIFFFVSTSPLMISKTTQSIFPIQSNARPTVSVIDMVLYIAIQCNFSFNFIMYFWTGSLFREEFRNVVRDIKSAFLRRRL